MGDKHKEKEVSRLINDFKSNVKKWNDEYKESDIQFIYNENLDQLDVHSIKYILVGDNPGVNEKKVNKYLIGSSGLMARSFFKSELDVVDFNKEVLVLNKTPLYSAITSDLYEISKCNKKILSDTQKYMCQLIYNLQRELNCEVIVSGFGGSRNGGKWDLSAQSKRKINPETKKKTVTMFPFFQQLKSSLIANKEFAEKVFIVQHFSGGRIFNCLAKEFKDIENLDKEKFLEYGKKYTNELRNSTVK